MGISEVGTAPVAAAPPQRLVPCRFEHVLTATKCSEMLRTIDRQDHNVSIQNRDAATCRGETRAAPPDCLTARATISEPLIAWTIPARDPKFRVRSAAPTPQMWAKDGSENRLGKKRSGKGRPVSRKRFSTFKTRPTLNNAPSSDHCS